MHIILEYEEVSNYIKDEMYVQTILKTMSAVRRETYIHSYNTACYTLLMTKAITKKEECIKQIVIGALLHDVGKVGVPIEILEKKEKLTNADIETIKKHPVNGEDLLSPFFSEHVRKIALMHHEKLDGSGYPKNQRKIPDYVQLVTIADMYDAMTSKRNYKRGFTHEETILQLKKDAEQGRLNIAYIELLDKILLQRKRKVM